MSAPASQPAEVSPAAPSPSPARRAIAAARCLARALRELARIIFILWTRPIRAEPLALLRIVAGATILIGCLAGIAPNLSLYWTADSLIPHGVAEDYAQYNDRFSLLLLNDSLPAVIAWFCLWIVALLFVIAGCFTRIACAVAWVMAVSFNFRAYWVLNGGDDVALLTLFYLMVAPSGAAWSADSLRRRLKRYRDPDGGFDSLEPPREYEPTFIPPWSVRLIQIQLSLIYLFNGLNKINPGGVNDYLTGEAIYWTYNDTTLSRFAYDMLPAPLIICRLLSWGTLVFEIGFPIFVMFARLRPWTLIVGVLFHVGIFFSMEIGWFSQNMIAMYPIMLSGAAVTGFVVWLSRRGARKPFRLYYDTFCPVCRRAKFVLQSLDIGRRIEFGDIHDRDAMAADAPGVSYNRALREMIVVCPRGKVTGGFDAFRTVARGLPALWALLPLLFLPGVGYIGRRVYQWVARNRYKFNPCDAETCNLHLRALSKEDIDESEIARIVEQARTAASNAANVQ